jgi:hypothetical protein
MPLDPVLSADVADGQRKMEAGEVLPLVQNCLTTASAMHTIILCNDGQDLMLPAACGKKE